MFGLAALFGAVGRRAARPRRRRWRLLAVPTLVFGLGLPLSAAVPASLVVIGLASAVAVAPRARRQVNWRLAGIVGAAGVPAALLGGVVKRRLDQQILLLAFAAVMIIAGVRMLRATDESGGVCDLPDGGVAWRRSARSPPGSPSGFLTGLLLLVAAGVTTQALVALTPHPTSTPQERNNHGHRP
jgi:uncharacterized protein